MSASVESSNSLILLRKEKEQTIYDYSLIIKKLEIEISTIDKQIVEKCDHVWGYDPPVIYERGYYYCTKCRTIK